MRYLLCCWYRYLTNGDVQNGRSVKWNLPVLASWIAQADDGYVMWSAALVPPHLGPMVGPRLGAEDDAVKATITYSRAHSIRFPAGTIDIPEHLSIEFDWDDLIGEIEDERVIYVDVGRDMQLALWPGAPIRLLALFGPYREESDWRLADQLVGSDVWRRALGTIGSNNSAMSFEIRGEDLVVFEGAWIEIFRNHQMNPVRPLPPSRSERERAMEIFMNDPEFIRRGVVVARQLFGDSWE